MRLSCHTALAKWFSQRIIWSGHHSIYKTHFLDLPFALWKIQILPWTMTPMAWWHELSELIWHYLSLCSPSAFPHWWLPFRSTCVPSPHPSPGCSLVFRCPQDLALAACPHRSNGTYPLDLSQVITALGVLTVLTSSYSPVKCSPSQNQLQLKAYIHSYDCLINAYFLH